MIAKTFELFGPFSTPINFELPMLKNCITKNLKTNYSLFCLHERDQCIQTPPRLDVCQDCQIVSSGGRFSFKMGQKHFRDIKFYSEGGKYTQAGLVMFAIPQFTPGTLKT